MSARVDWLARRAELTGGRVALVEARTGRRVTYRAWNEQVLRTARLLFALGVRQGDRVGVLAHNGIDYLDLLFACDKLGAIVQNLNWRLTAAEIAPLLEATQPRVLAYGEALAAIVDELERRSSPVGAYLALGAPAAPHHTGLGARNAHDALPLPVGDRSAEDPWLVCYTGGSTGTPKGAVLSQATVTWNAINTLVGWGLRDDDVAVLAAPLFHAGGLNVFTLPLVYCGGTSIVCERFDPDSVFDLVASRGATLLFGVPTMFSMLVDHPRWPSADLSSLRICISAVRLRPPSSSSGSGRRACRSRPATA